MKALTMVCIIFVAITFVWCDEVTDMDFAVSVPGSNTLAGQGGDAGAVFKKPATALGDLSSPWPATADYGGGVKVTPGSTYALDLFWCNDGGVVAKPTWARTAIVGIGGVSSRPDGRFTATSDGFLLVQWWDVRDPTKIWISSTPVYVK